mmetsp:Transcript_52978/g.147535  ORF Transcript_52978/g.147535 Transcript_52978/m.147535 type:complete len:499 (-) Transcript_52978:2398-3894(-)
MAPIDQFMMTIMKNANPLITPRTNSNTNEERYGSAVKTNMPTQAQTALMMTVSWVLPMITTSASALTHKAAVCHARFAVQDAAALRSAIAKSHSDLYSTASCAGMSIAMFTWKEYLQAFILPPTIQMSSLAFESLPRNSPSRVSKLRVGNFSRSCSCNCSRNRSIQQALWPRIKRFAGRPLQSWYKARWAQGSWGSNPGSYCHVLSTAPMSGVALLAKSPQRTVTSKRLRGGTRTIAVSPNSRGPCEGDQDDVKGSLAKCDVKLEWPIVSQPESSHRSAPKKQITSALHEGLLLSALLRNCAFAAKNGLTATRPVSQCSNASGTISRKVWSRFTSADDTSINCLAAAVEDSIQNDGGNGKRDAMRRVTKTSPHAALSSTHVVLLQHCLTVSCAASSVRSLSALHQWKAHCIAPSSASENTSALQMVAVVWGFALSLCVVANLLRNSGHRSWLCPDGNTPGMPCCSSAPRTLPATVTAIQTMTHKLIILGHIEVPSTNK